jgi:hypothetical protein
MARPRQKVRKKFGPPTKFQSPRWRRVAVRDLGADGVYRTWAAQYNVYQLKFRTGRPALTWKELSTFWA